MRKFLIACALVLCASSAYADHGRKTVDPSHGSSWKWHPNPPVVVCIPPVRGPGVVRPIMPPTCVVPFVQSAQVYQGYGAYGGYRGGVYRYGSPQPTAGIIVNPYCNCNQ